MPVRRSRPGYRSILIVPMLRDDVAIGAIAVMRLEPQLFPKAQVELLKTFAGQAVIAIENTRLFTELQERSRQLSQSLEDLRAAQDSLVQTEKLAALGRLVAGSSSRDQHPCRDQPDGSLGIYQQDQSI